MKLPRRRFLHLALGATALPATSGFAWAQTYPTRPITIVVPFAVGGATDVIGRIVAERMRASLGQPIIIENLTGASGTLGVGRGARAAPDGYTLVIGQWTTFVGNGAVYALQYDLLNDFEPISLLVETPLLVIAKKAMSAKDLKEFIAWLKANPNKKDLGPSRRPPGRSPPARHRPPPCRAPSGPARRCHEPVKAKRRDIEGGKRELRASPVADPESRCAAGHLVLR